MKIYLVRHGETEWNKKGKIQGQADIPLNEEGKRTALLTGQALLDRHFDRIYSSPLSRAFVTAELITGADKEEIRVDKRLLEISYGSREGQNLKLIARFPVLRLHKFFSSPDHYIPPKNGETFQILRNRVVDFFQNELRPLEGREESVMAVTHGGFIRETLMWIKDRPRKDFWNGAAQENCAVTVLELKDGKFFVLEEGKIYY